MPQAALDGWEEDSQHPLSLFPTHYSGQTSAGDAAFRVGTAPMLSLPHLVMRANTYSAMMNLGAFWTVGVWVCALQFGVCHPGLV